MSAGKFLAGFSVGGAIGAVAGILLAPKSGEETRQILADGAKDALKRADETVKQIQNKADDVVSDMQRKGEEIKEFDEYSNFKRFSLVNIDTNEIMINGNKIDLFQFYPRNLENGNSFQLSFYDIGKKYIVSKDGKITEIKENKDEFFGRVKESDEIIKPIN